MALAVVEFHQLRKLRASYWCHRGPVKADSNISNACSSNSHSNMDRSSNSCTPSQEVGAASVSGSAGTAAATTTTTTTMPTTRPTTTPTTTPTPRQRHEQRRRRRTTTTQQQQQQQHKQQQQQQQQQQQHGARCRVRTVGHIQDAARAAFRSKLWQ